MTLFRDKYRVESARLPAWDYSSPGAYFVTLCTKGKQNWFGEIVDGTMRLSPVGKIVADEWKKTEQIRSDVSLDSWTVMPNHLHGIVVIHETSLVETHSSASLQPNKQNKFGPQRNNLASIIRGFKSASTKRIRLSGCPQFVWQTRYYDHIIRDEKSLKKIREYIADNAMQWEFDRNHPCGLNDWM